MKPETLGLLGGVIGSVLGLTGGAVGTYFSIKNTHSARERAFAVRASIICWLLVAAFLGGMLLLPSPQRYLLWLPYALLLPIGIRLWTRTQTRIRQEESAGSAESR